MGQVIIIRKQGGLGRKALTEDMISGLVQNGVAVSGGAQLNTVYELNSPQDAINLGLDEAYDTTNLVLVFHHIKEFFRICPDGKLFLMLISQATSLTTACLKTTTNGVAKLLRDPLVSGKIRQVAVALNPASGYTPTIASGLDNDVLQVNTGVYSGAAVNLQALIAEEETLKRPVIGVLEGRSFTGVTANLLDARVAVCPQVAITLGADKDVSARNALQNGYANVGAMLGMIARRQVNQNIGWVADSNLQDASTGDYVKPGMAGNTLLSSYSETDLTALQTKGFITLKTYTGYPGCFFADSDTAIVTSNDYATIENNRVIQKAIRLVYARLVPFINSTIQVDASTGKIAPAVCKFFEQEAAQALSPMQTAQELSGLDTYVNPDQDVLSTSEITVNIEIVPTGVARKIIVPIGFKNPFNA
jgi:hypothetical protein